MLFSKRENLGETFELWDRARAIVTQPHIASLALPPPEAWVQDAR